jgi:hypothetical protein
MNLDQGTARDLVGDPMTGRPLASEREGGVMSLEAPQTRELAVRDSDGVHVLLLWHPEKNAVTVSVEDARVGDRFHVAVAPDRALEAFYHPFAYAA